LTCIISNEKKTYLFSPVYHMLFLCSLNVFKVLSLSLNYSNLMIFSTLYFILFHFLFEIGSLYVVEAGLKL
jgi:hypothetical protein